ncbi:hypothetical protein [Nocardia lasii]|uniref:Uncharacterized protein n=1 Tax=Nocardia lasii TaxID=1616107 RepID=A0ABW1JWP3_9NOCA
MSTATSALRSFDSTAAPQPLPRRRRIPRTPRPFTLVRPTPSPTENRARAIDAPPASTPVETRAPADVARSIVRSGVLSAPTNTTATEPADIVRPPRRIPLTDAELDLAFATVPRSEPAMRTERTTGTERRTGDESVVRTEPRVHADRRARNELVKRGESVPGREAATHPESVAGRESRTRVGLRPSADRGPRPRAPRTEVSLYTRGSVPSARPARGLHPLHRVEQAKVGFATLAVTALVTALLVVAFLLLAHVRSGSFVDQIDSSVPGVSQQSGLPAMPGTVR